MDGEITIGTTLSTDKFDRQILELEKKMKREEDKKIIIKTQLDTQTRDLEEARERTDKLADAYQRLKEISSNLNTFKARFGEYGEIKSQFGDLQEIERNFNSALRRQDALEQKVNTTRLRYQAINDKVDEYKQKIESVNLQRQVSDVSRLSSDVSKLGSGFDKVGHSIQSSISKVARLALGVFGVRSAYLALRRASSDLASYDTQYATNLEYIRYVLTQMIAPVLRWIVQMAATLLGYINAILNGWFGINLFSRGSAKNFAKMKAGAGGVAKAVKEIKKQLAGFDEINMVTDQSSSGVGGGGAGGVAMPDFDLSKIQGDPPKWLKWIIDNRDLILAILAGIAAALIAWQLGLGAIKSLGIGLIVAGVVYAIQGLLKYLEAPTWKNFGKIIQGIGLVVIGLGVAFLGLPAVITGVAVLILGTVIRYWEQIKAFLQKGLDWLTGKSDWVHEMFGDLIGSIYDSIVKMLQGALNYANSFFTSLKNIFDGIIKFIKGVFTGNWKLAFEGLKQIVFNVLNIILSRIQFIFNTIVNVVRAKINIIISFFGDMASKVIGFFNKIATKVPQAIGTKFKSVMNAVIRAIERILNKPISAINSLISRVNDLPRSFNK